jgi:predicted lipoprotein with Yx(FWY)xxD motif
MKLTLTCLALSAALLLAACGGNDDGDATASSGSTTVSLDDGLLVDSSGAALYTSEQERSGKVVCTASCTEIWLPLTAPSSGQPKAGDGVSGELGTLKRPDGSRQVTLGGRPLYRFAEDTEAGKATGDGLTDSFDGRRFTWHAEGKAESSSSGDDGGRSYSY